MIILGHDLFKSFMKIPGHDLFEPCWDISTDIVGWSDKRKMCAKGANVCTRRSQRQQISVKFCDIFNLKLYSNGSPLLLLNETYFIWMNTYF